MAYLDAGQPERGLPLLEQALQTQTAKLSPWHQDTRITRDNLILAYKKAGHVDRTLSHVSWTVVDSLGVGLSDFSGASDWWTRSYRTRWL
jgi:hypothetical protein